MNEVLFWGAFGLLTEVVFTAVKNTIIEKKANLMGHTSLWMYPVYAFGLTYGFDFINFVISNEMVRYLTYPLWIWAVEIAIGYPAVKMGLRIWDYGYLPDRWHWNRIISFAHFPLWILFGILVEIIRAHI